MASLPLPRARVHGPSLPNALILFLFTSTSLLLLS